MDAIFPTSSGHSQLYWTITPPSSRLWIWSSFGMGLVWMPHGARYGRGGPGVGGAGVWGGGGGGGGRGGGVARGGGDGGEIREVGAGDGRGGVVGRVWVRGELDVGVALRGDERGGKVSHRAIGEVADHRHDHHAHWGAHAPPEAAPSLARGFLPARPIPFPHVSPRAYLAEACGSRTHLQLV